MRWVRGGADPACAFPTRNLGHAEPRKNSPSDYMLIPLVTAECFGTASLGKLLALIIKGYSIGQWTAPWIGGRIFDVQNSYALAGGIIAIAGLLGAAAVYAIPSSSRLRGMEMHLAAIQDRLGGNVPIQFFA
jgi:hypothetical protein